MKTGRDVLAGGLLMLPMLGLANPAAMAQEKPEAVAKTAEQGAILIGMGFLPFLWLLIVAVVISLLMYFLLGTKLAGGPAMNIAVGWIGAWLGSPVFGHWFEAVSAHGVYFIPAILGCAGMVYGCHSCQRFASTNLEKALQASQPQRSTESARPEKQGG